MTEVMPHNDDGECGFICFGGETDDKEENREIARIFAVDGHIEVPIFGADSDPDEDGTIWPDAVMVFSPSKAKFFAELLIHAADHHCGPPPTNRAQRRRNGR